MVFIEEGEINR